ncbi:SAM domain and HD [Chytridiales sp. JEL 0842]|nr:SAM domain and HD [Chytridiales sp. JEL 0842]
MSFHHQHDRKDGNNNSLPIDAAFFYNKSVNDPIHGLFELEDYCWSFIDTPQYQRLRDLKQLGSAYFVFPGASHNRFEHSLGVAHLASTLIKKLDTYQPDLKIEPWEEKCVTIAGLCHDLGHGPFSHVFDNEFIPAACPGVKWEHEEMSEKMLQYMIDDNQIEQLDESEVKFVKRLIRGVSPEEYAAGMGMTKSDGRMFLYDIVANKRNSVDVDKFDYISRDCAYLGMKTGYDYKRAIHFSRVVQDQICWSHKEAFNLYELFHTRFSLFKQVYTHKVGKAIEYMLVDALLAANPYMEISSAINDVKQYSNLTDSIIREIERSTKPELEASRTIIRRIRRRDLYRCADFCILPYQLQQRIQKSDVTPEKILGHQLETDEVKLTEDDVKVEWLPLTYAMKSANPVDRSDAHRKPLQDIFRRWLHAISIQYGLQPTHPSTHDITHAETLDTPLFPPTNPSLGGVISPFSVPTNVLGPFSDALMSVRSSSSSSLGVVRTWDDAASAAAHSQSSMHSSTEERGRWRPGSQSPVLRRGLSSVGRVGSLLGEQPEDEDEEDEEEEEEKEEGRAGAGVRRVLPFGIGVAEGNASTGFGGTENPLLGTTTTTTTMTMTTTTTMAKSVQQDSGGNPHSSKKRKLFEGAQSPSPSSTPIQTPLRRNPLLPIHTTTPVSVAGVVVGASPGLTLAPSPAYNLPSLKEYAEIRSSSPNKPGVKSGK